VLLSYIWEYIRSYLVNNDSEMTMRTFYAAANAIYSRVKSASEVAALFLVGTFLLPLLTYASEAHHTIPYSLNNVADIHNLQQYCSIEHYQSGRTKVYDSYIVKET